MTTQESAVSPASRSPLYIAMRVDEYPEHSRAAGRVLNAAASHLAALARLLRLSSSG